MPILKEHVRRLTSKGQVTIPADVRERLGLKPGEHIIFRLLEDRVEIDRPAMTLEEAFGSVTPLQQPEDFEELAEIARAEHASKVLQEMQVA